MPNYGTILSVPATELSAVNAKVWINSMLYPYASVLRLQKTKGALPGEATIRFALAQHEDSPATLNRYLVNSGSGTEQGDMPQFGSRVVIFAGATPIFTGHLIRRQDSARDDSVIWTALDDRDLLAAIPVRGALVYDEYTGDVHFLPSFSPRTNPDGAWNCTFQDVEIKQRQYSGTTNAVESVKTVVTAPVFFPYAKHVMVYEEPDLTWTGTPDEPGMICAWTPRRFLQYLCVIANLAYDSAATEGLNYQTWRSIADCPYLQWAYWKINGLRGIDPAYGADSTFDPLDAKMPDINFQGQALLAAIDHTLAVSGTHDFTLDRMAGRGGDIWKDVVGELSFFPVGWSGLASGEQPKSIPLLRRGTVADAESCVDFDILMDSTQTRDCALVEGDVVKLECRLECTVDEYGVVDPNSTLLPAWTMDSLAVQAGGAGTSQQTGFLQVIHGASLATANKDAPGKYAKFPPDITKGNPPAFSGWLDADGTGGKPLAYPHMPEAVALARQMFPTVFRAFYVNTKKLHTASGLTQSGILAGSLSQFTDATKYPILNWKRPILPTQLQYQTNDLGLPASAEANWLLSRYPIRVEVKYDGKWHDIGQQTGFYMTGDGLIWCESLGERSFPGYDSIIDPRPSTSGSGGDGWRNPGGYTLRSFRLNVSIPLDHRVFGYKNNPRQSVFEAKYQAALGGPRMLYVDSPHGYKEHHQRDSYPAALVGGGVAQNRILASGNERKFAEYAAQRRLALANRITTNSIWRFAGIRTDWNVGDWVEEVRPFVTGTSTYQEKPFPIQAPIGYITYDFQNQKTEVGGIYSNLGGM